MKKLLLTFLFLLSVIVGKAQTPYAIWCEGNTTLYFTADGNNYTPGGTYNGQTITNVWSGNYITQSGSSYPSWHSIVVGSVKNVVFDSSFKARQTTATPEHTTHIRHVGGVQVFQS